MSLSNNLATRRSVKPEINITKLRGGAIIDNNQINTSDPADHVYIDVNLFNNSAAAPPALGLDQYIDAEINITRDTPLITDTQYYNLTLARFAINSSYIPRVFQPIGTTGGNTPWFVGLSYNNVYYTEPIVVPTITSPSGAPLKELFNIQGFLDLINVGYAAAQTAAVIGGAPTGPTGSTVFMSFDPVTQLYIVNVPTYFGTGGVGVTAGNGIGVHMSYPLYEKFDSFNVIQNSPLLYTAGNNSDITFIREFTGYNYQSVAYLSGVTSGPYMQLKQDAIWGSSINTVNRLQVVVTQIPITQEYVSITNAVAEQGAPGNQIFPILTDFLIESDAELQSKAQNYLYTPTLYRITTLQGSPPLVSFSIKIYVVTHTGVRIPLKIAPGGCLCLKLLFLKKGLTS